LWKIYPIAPISLQWNCILSSSNVGCMDVARGMQGALDSYKIEICVRKNRIPFKFLATPLVGHHNWMILSIKFAKIRDSLNKLKTELKLFENETMNDFQTLCGFLLNF